MKIQKSTGTIVNLKANPPFFMETNTPEEKQKLIRLLTGTDSPKFLTERENVMIDKFLELSSEKDEQLKYCHGRMTEAYNEIRSKESRIALLEEALRGMITAFASTNYSASQENAMANSIKVLSSSIKENTQEK